MISILLVAGIAYGIAYWISSTGLAYWRAFVGFMLGFSIGWFGGSAVSALLISQFFSLDISAAEKSIFLKSTVWALLGAGYGVYRARFKLKTGNPAPPFAFPKWVLKVVGGMAVIGIAAAVAIPAYQDYTKGQGSAVRPLVPALSTPDSVTAINELFGVTDSSGSYKTAPNELTSFWHEQSFQVEQKKAHVVFTKTQTINPATNKPVEDHAAAPMISAIVYEFVGDKWQVVSKSIKIGAFGSWGDAQASKSADILTIAPGVVAFMFDAGGGMGGYYEEGKVLFAYSKKGWQNLGYIETGGNNSGEGCSEPSCQWEYTGKISVASGQNLMYPDLVVTRIGTERDDKRNVVPVKNASYRFNGEKYDEVRGKITSN